MRFFIATLFLLWGSNALAASSHEPTPALVTGDVISAGLVMQSAEVVGLTDSGALLTQGLATKNGQRVGFVALLDKNDQIQWSISDGDTWPEGGVVADVHASQLLFDGSFLVHGSAVETTTRTVIYRMNPAGQMSAIFDCEIPSLNQDFCTETTSPEPAHDMTGTVLLIAEDSAWRLINGVYQQVFDFETGDELPRGAGTLADHVSCIGQKPITDWTLDGRGGVVAVVYVKKPDDHIGPAILRQQVDDAFVVEVPYAYEGPNRFNVCSRELYGADLFGMMFKDSYALTGGLIDGGWEIKSDLIQLLPFTTNGVSGPVSGLRFDGTGLYALDHNHGDAPLQRGAQFGDDPNVAVVALSADVARGGWPAAVLTLSDGSDVLVLGTGVRLADTQVVKVGQIITIRSSQWEVADLRLTAFTAGLYSGSVTSDGALAFTMSDAATGKNAVMRVVSDVDFVVNSTSDSSTMISGDCAVEGAVWDGRPACGLRAAVEAASTHENTSIAVRLSDHQVSLSRPLEVSSHVAVHGRAKLISDSDIWVVTGGSLSLGKLEMESELSCLRAEDAERLVLVDVEMRARAGYGVRSIRSGPVELTRGDILFSQVGVYVDGSTPAESPLLSLNETRVANNEVSVYATGSTTIHGSLIASSGSAGVIMDGTDNDVLTVKFMEPTSNRGNGFVSNRGPGIHTLRGKLILEGGIWFSDNVGFAIDAGGPVEFRNSVPDPVKVAVRYLRGQNCRDLRFVDYEPRFTPITCTGYGIRLRTLEPTAVIGVTSWDVIGAAIVADGPVSLESVDFIRTSGAGVFSYYSGPGPAVSVGPNTTFQHIKGPAIQTLHGDVLVTDAINLDGTGGGFDVGGNIVFSAQERSIIRGIDEVGCRYWQPALERAIAKKCGFSPMISHATTGTNIFENVDFFSNRGPAIWAHSAVELRDVAIIGNDGGVITSSPNNAIILHENVRILGNQGPGLVAKEGNIKAVAPFRVERNEGAGIIVQNGDFVFENDSDTRAKIHNNAVGEACAPVGDQESYPVYERCIRAGLFVPNGKVISSGMEVTENVGEGIAADHVELSSSTVCGNSGAQIASLTEVLDDVDLCNKIVELESKTDDGCSSTSGLVSPIMLLGLLGLRRRRRANLASKKTDGTSART